MRILLEIPDAVYGKWAELADTRGVKVGNLLADAVEGLIGQGVVPPRGHPNLKVTPEVLAQAVATPAERLQAAIDRLAELRDESTQGGWYGRQNILGTNP